MFPPSLLRLCCWLALATAAFAHGTLVNGRMYNVRLAGPNGNTPAGWNESFYTWNQNSNNFPNYNSPSFSYANVVPEGTIASAGINDGTQSALNFSSLNIPSPLWKASAATAGQPFSLSFIATAPHEPSFFQVYFTKPDFDPTTMVLGWDELVDLGKWSLGDATHPVTTGSGSSPAGGSLFAYNWNIPIPTTASGREMVVVVWQRQDPAGEAFFAVQDLQVAAIPEPATAGLAMLGVGALWLPRRVRSRA